MAYEVGDNFAKIVEILDTNGASFVSVTQQFKTTSSMGRLTLNVLLSFAQFEREVMGERIRDKIAASKKKGMWMGGVPPLGYRAQDRKLVIIDSDCSLDLSLLCGTRLGPAFEGRARSPKDRQQIVDERVGSPRRRQAVLTRCALLDFAEPYLSRIRIAGNKAASSRSLTSAAG